MMNSARLRRVAVAVLLSLLCSSVTATPGDCSSELCGLVSAGRLPGLRWPDFSADRARIQSFYEPTGYSFAWIDSKGVTRSARSVIEILKEAASKGLDPEDYDASRWAARIAALDSANLTQASTSLDAARFDLALTICVMRYVSDLQFGKIDPGLFRGNWGIDSDHKNLASFVRNGLTNSDDPHTVLESIEPPYEGYRRTLNALQRYVALATEGPVGSMPATSKPVEPGKPYPASAQLAITLRRFGDLPLDALPPPDGFYAGSLIEAVKRFQARHGLDVDGRIGKATVAALNTPIDRRIRQLQLTLERWRWVPQAFPVPPIVVNIPEFKLRALDSDFHTALEMKIVVGKAQDQQTPMLASRMTSIGFWPYWDVPLSIQHKELLPKIVADRSYLAKNGFEVVNAKREIVSTGDVDDDVLAGLRASRLFVRQVPGPRNSLGLIKFDFPNPADIYMHDTPAASLFGQSRRDFSHGCIRLEKPEELARWVLRETPDWTPARIHEAIKGEKTFGVRLAQPIPVLIVYATAVVLENGEVRFLPDIYGLDAQLESLLAKGYPYSAASRDSTSAARGPRPRE